MLMAEANVVCVVCKASLVHSARYWLWDSVQRGGRPTALYRQLRTVAGADLPAQLSSEFVCVSCRTSILTALAQKERFENFRRKLLQKFHTVQTSSELRPALQATVSTPPSRLPEKRPRLSPLARTGISPRAKRPFPDATNTTESKLLPPARQLTRLGDSQRVVRRELFALPRPPMPSRATRLPIQQQVLYILQTACIYSYSEFNRSRINAPCRPASKCPLD